MSISSFVSPALRNTNHNRYHRRNNERFVPQKRQKRHVSLTFVDRRANETVTVVVVIGRGEEQNSGPNRTHPSSPSTATSFDLDVVGRSFPTHPRCRFTGAKDTISRSTASLSATLMHRDLQAGQQAPSFSLNRAATTLSMPPPPVQFPNPGQECHTSAMPLLT